MLLVTIHLPEQSVKVESNLAVNLEKKYSLSHSH